MNSKNQIVEKSHVNKQNEKTSYQFNIKIDKKLFTNILLILLITLASLQTWQLMSLQAKISQVKSGNAQSVNQQKNQPSSSSPSGGGVNSLPSQVGGC